MPVGDVWEARIEMVQQNNPNSYGWYLQVVQEPAPQDTGKDVIEFAKARKAALLGLHSIFTEFQCVTARQIHPTKSVPEIDVEQGLGNRDCATCGVLPGQCCVVATLWGDPAAPTKNNRGRDFFTGMCAADQTNGVFDSGPVSILQEYCDMYQAMGNDFTGAFGTNFAIGIFSPTLAKADLADPQNEIQHFWQLQKVRVKSLVRTQRRRQPLDPCEAFCEADIT